MINWNGVGHDRSRGSKSATAIIRGSSNYGGTAYISQCF